MNYPHMLRVVVPAEGGTPGGQNDDTGGWTPGVTGEDVIYDGPADVQDSAGQTIRRDTTGTPVETSDAVAFLDEAEADEDTMDRFQPGQVAHVTWENGAVSDAEISRVTRIDLSLALRFL